MSLRSLLFSTDEQTAQPIGEVLAGLDVEVESCSEAAAAAEMLTQEPFQIVLVDWDNQPEAGLLLNAARDRKPAERPLTLAIVSNDDGIPKALQAGANSILRKPIMPSQVADTLRTARDLLRAREGSATAKAAAAAAASSAPATIGAGPEPVLRAGEFLQSTGSAAPTQFDIESDFQKSLEQPASAEMDPLKDLEPMAAEVSQSQEPPEAPPAVQPESSEPHGLEWYLNRNKVAAPLPPVPKMAAAAAVPAKPELLGFDQNPSAAQNLSAGFLEQDKQSEPTGGQPNVSEQKAEAQLFAYMSGEDGAKEQKTPKQARLRIGKRTIIGAAVLAGCAIVAAPQAPWHSSMQRAWGRGQQALRAWLNPQPVTPPQAPVAHENFARAGDEYKLPVAENIPDATTDPSQIRVVPVVDPTAKKPTSDAGANPSQPAVQGETGGATPADAGSPAVQVQENPPIASPITPADGADGAAEVTPPPVPHTEATSPTDSVGSVPQLPAPRNPAPHVVSSSASNSGQSSPTAAIPSSLKSQMASMTPEASGNKSPEAALPSIEPVDVPEAAERALLIEQPPVAYPPNAKGQQGTVVLQIFIGRDGSVQDAKFLQGSLAFARTAIDGVKQWRFKPYLMNGRPVSVQTKMTLAFKPGS